MVITLKALSRSALIGFAILAGSRGFAYITYANVPGDELPGAIKAFSLPVEVWVIAWFLVGAITLVTAIRAWPWGYLPSIFINLLWAMGYIFSSINATTPRSLANAVLYLAIVEFALIAFLLTGRRRRTYFPEDDRE